MNPRIKRRPKSLLKNKPLIQSVGWKGITNFNQNPETLNRVWLMCLPPRLFQSQNYANLPHLFSLQITKISQKRGEKKSDQTQLFIPDLGFSFHSSWLCLKSVLFLVLAVDIPDSYAVFWYCNEPATSQSWLLLLLEYRISLHSVIHLWVSR